MNIIVQIYVLISAAALVTTNACAAAIPVAEYTFNHNLSSSVAGGPALVAVDPLGQSGFRTDTVFGAQRTVYDFIGAPQANQQAGLALNVAGLISDANTYTVEMQFLFTQRDGQYRRILDVANRRSDNGFYVDIHNTLQVFPLAGGSLFTNGTYHDVVLSNNNGAVTWYLDGSQNTVNTSVMDISSANMLNFFLDNSVGPGIGEYSSGSVALIRVFNEALTAQQVALLPATSVPEPTSLALLATGLLVLATARRRRCA